MVDSQPQVLTKTKQTSATVEVTQPSQPLDNYFKKIILTTYNLSTPKTISAIESSEVPAPNAKDPTPAGPSQNCAIDEG